jgi:hypothetical protein
VLQPAFQTFHERAFSGAHRTYEIQNLAALFTFEGCRVKIAHNLVQRALHAIEVFCKEVEDSQSFAFEDALETRRFFEIHFGDTCRNDRVVHTLVGKLRDLRSLTNDF